MDWAGFRFQDPVWLWAALLAPLVLAATWLRERHGRAIVFRDGLRQEATWSRLRWHSRARSRARSRSR